MSAQAVPAGATRTRVLPATAGINAVFLEPGMGGLDTYVQELVGPLLTHAPQLRLSVFCTPTGRDHLRACDWADGVEFVTHPLLGRRGTRAISEVTLLGWLAGRRVDLLHSAALTAPLRTRAVNVVVIADVTWIVDPPPGPTVRLWRAIVPTVARRADRVVAISQAGARDIASHLRVPADRIDVTLLGHATRPLAQPLGESALRERFALGDGPLVLSVGTRKPHKNLLRLVQAFAGLDAPDARLVLAGNPTSHDDELRAEASNLGVSERVTMLPFVDDAELEGLYAAADCFVLASTNEGFGLPVLEAMARGTPVACSQASALPEVAGDAARYFDPLDVGDMAAAIDALLADRALRERLVDRGRERAAEMTWTATAQATLDCWERAWRQRR